MDARFHDSFPGQIFVMVPRTFIATVVSTLLCIGCSSGADPRTDRPVDDGSSAQEHTMSESDESEDELEVQTWEGRIEIDPTAGGKRFQGTWLVVDDGEPLLVAYRPKEKYFPYYDRRVIVEGKEYTPDPQTQHIQARHLRVHSIEIAEGDSPIEPEPTRLPAPPTVADARKATERDGRWTLVVGILEDLESPEVGTTYRARLRLEDDAAVRLGAISGEALQGLDEGQKVTVLGRVLVDDDGQLSIDDVYTVCPGHEPRCGIDG